jgi:hypothetical protein
MELNDETLARYDAAAMEMHNIGEAVCKACPTVFVILEIERPSAEDVRMQRPRKSTRYNDHYFVTYESALSMRPKTDAYGKYSYAIEEVPSSEVDDTFEIRRLLIELVGSSDTKRVKREK